MNKLLKRLTEIGRAIENSDHGLALLALGSSGIERHRIDEYSDLDFFVICEAGFKQEYLSNIAWLTQIAPVAFYFRNTIDGYKLLYEDDVFCEFAVFEPDELSNIPFSRGKIVWAKPGFDVSICEPVPKQVNLVDNDRDYHLGEALTNLYVGVGRYHRGEKLSAYHSIQSYAFGHVIELMARDNHATENIDGDSFNVGRRFESRYPNFARELSTFLLGYDQSLIVAERILVWLDTHYLINQKMKHKITELIRKPK
jgi:hypothetical protein